MKLSKQLLKLAADLKLQSFIRNPQSIFSNQNLTYLKKFFDIGQIDFSDVTEEKLRWLFAELIKSAGSLEEMQKVLEKELQEQFAARAAGSLKKLFGVSLLLFALALIVLHQKGELKIGELLPGGSSTEQTGQADESWEAGSIQEQQLLTEEKAREFKETITQELFPTSPTEKAFILTVTEGPRINYVSGKPQISSGLYVGTFGNRYGNVLVISPQEIYWVGREGVPVSQESRLYEERGGQENDWVSYFWPKPH